MNILVGGGAGYIGSVLVPILEEHGYQVTVVDELWFGNHLPDTVRVLPRNLFDLAEPDFEGFDQVIFLGGLSNDPMAEYRPARNFIENGALPSYLAFTAKKAGVRRFIYASSCSIYGYTVNELYDEDAPVTCAYPYGISKLQGERGVLQLQDETFSTIALRQGTVCGHSPRMRFDLIVNTMFQHALTRGRITIDNPAIWRPILDVRDAATAFVRAVQAEESISGIFNVAYENYTVGQVGDIVREELMELTGEKIRLEVHNRKDFRNYKVSCERARTCLGFHPKYAVADTVHDLYRHREAYGDFQSDAFYNIRVFRQMDPE